MYKNIILLLLLIFSVSCSSTNQYVMGPTGMEDPIHATEEEKESKFTVRKALAMPFYIVGGGLAIGGGVTLSLTNDDDDDDSVFENKSDRDSDTALVGLGMLAGGAMLWLIGDMIDH